MNPFSLKPFFSHFSLKLALPGLPPLPKSLSGFQEAPINDVPSEEISRPSQTPQSQTSTLDTQLATLRREMVSSDIILTSFTFINTQIHTNQNE